MFYLKCKIKSFLNNILIVESNLVGYKGYKLFKEEVEKNQELILYVVNYKNEYVNDYLFFKDESSRNLSEFLLSLKNIGVTTIKKIFTNISYKELISICENQSIETMIKSTKLSEQVSKKIVQEVRIKLFNKKYNAKQMSIINSLNKLGYKISDIYKSIQNVDLNLKEEIILEKVILNLNAYGN